MSFINDVECRIPDKSAFNLTHKKRMSLQFDNLYPTMLLETLPGDKFRVSQNNVSRFAPMLTPAFGDCKLYTHYFYVPRRIVEPYWKEFYTREKRADGSEFVSLRTYYANLCNSSNQYPEEQNVLDSEVLSEDGTIFGKRSLAEYLGIKPLARGTCVNKDVSAPVFTTTNPYSGLDILEDIDLTPFIAYQYIWNEYYRDSQIDPDIFSEGEKNNGSLWWLTRDGWTEFLREHQSGGRFYGASAVSPVGAAVPRSTYYNVLLAGVVPLTCYSRANSLANNQNFDYQAYEGLIHNLFTLRQRAWYHDYFTSATTDITSGEIPIVPVTFQGYNVNSQPVNIKTSELYATASTDNATVSVNNTQLDVTKNARSWNLGFTISALRLANALQRFEEKSVKFGLRYIEQLASHFGVISSDASLQRPQFLGGTQCDAYVNEVTQTSESTQDSAQGNYAGHMMCADKGKEIEIYSEEHGWLFAITSVMCAPTYADGLHKMWNRNSDALNFYSPEFATLTDQIIRQREVQVLDNFTQISALNSGNKTNVTPFGYASRWDEYRGMLDTYCGQFRDKLFSWHFGRKFATIQDLVFAPYDGTLNPVQGPVVSQNHIRFWYKMYNDFDSNLSSAWSIPASVVSFNRKLTIQEKTDLANVNVAYAWVYVDMPFSDNNYNIIAMNRPQDVLPIDIVGLNPKFIHSKVSLAPFALTTEFENIGNAPALNRLGDDYIFASFENEVVAVRPMPEQVTPQI